MIAIVALIAIVLLATLQVGLMLSLKRHVDEIHHELTDSESRLSSRGIVLNKKVHHIMEIIEDNNGKEKE